MIFFPYYYNANLNQDLMAQMLIGIKSLIDFIFIVTLISSLLLMIKVYYNNTITPFIKNGK